MAVPSVTASVGRSLLGAYDVLACRRPSPEDVERALNTLQALVLAAALGERQADEGKAFLKLQSKPEWNATAVLLQWLSRVCGPLLEGGGGVSEDLTDNGRSVMADMPREAVGRALTLLQGLLHLHPASQHFFGRRPNMELLLTILPTALSQPSFDLLALPVLGLLLPTFLDSSHNTRLFESLGGLEMLVKAMKNRQARKEVRMMVVEVVWGWWMGEGGEGEMPGSDVETGAAAEKTDVPKLPAAVVEARPCPKSSLGIPVSVSAIDFTQHRQREDEEVVRQQSRSQESPRARSRSRKTVIIEASKASSVAPAMAHTPSRSTTMYFQPHRTPRSTTPVERVASREPKDIPLPETPAASRHLWITEPEAVAGKPNSNSTACVAPRSSSTDADPAIRLKTMLESTAKAFVPITPHHSRSPSKKKLAGGGNLGWGTPVDADAASALSQPVPPPKLLFPPPSPATDSASTYVRNGGSQGSTPQRILRHKKSASLGSLHFAHHQGGTGQNQPGVYPSPAGLSSSPSSARLAASAAPLLRHRSTASVEMRASPSSFALSQAVNIASPARSSPLTPSGSKPKRRHRPSASADFAIPHLPRSTSRLALAVISDDDDGGFETQNSRIPVGTQPTTPMRSAAGRALAASFVGEGLPASLPSVSNLKDRTTAEEDGEKENGSAQHKGNGKRTKRQSLLGQAIAEEPRMEQDDVKRSKLGLHMSNVDQLVRRFKEMGEGLQLK